MINTDMNNGAALSGPANEKISPMSASTTMCPAVMFAKRRIASAKGFVIFPIISTGDMIRKRTGRRTTGRSLFQ